MERKEKREESREEGISKEERKPMAVSVSRRLGEDIAWFKAGLSSNLPSPLMMNSSSLKSRRDKKPRNLAKHHKTGTLWVSLCSVS